MLENPHIFSHYFYYIYICVCFYPLSQRIWKETEVNYVDTFPTFIAFSTNLPPSQLLGPSVSFFGKVPSNWVDSSSQYSSGSLDLLIDSSEENQTSLSLIFSFALLFYFSIDQRNSLLYNHRSVGFNLKTRFFTFSFAFRLAFFLSRTSCACIVVYEAFRAFI